MRGIAIRRIAGFSCSGIGADARVTRGVGIFRRFVIDAALATGLVESFATSGLIVKVAEGLFVLGATRVSVRKRSMVSGLMKTSLRRRSLISE